MTDRGVVPRAARVVFVTVLSTGIAIVLQLVSVPVCMAYWGKEAYGVWLALFASFTLLRTVETGYVSFVGNRINLAYNQDRDVLRQQLSSSIAGIAVIGSLQLAACLLLFVDGVSTALGLDVAGFEPKTALLLLMAGWVFTGAYLSIVHKLMIPAGMMYHAAWWAMGFQVCQFGGIMLAARLRLSMIGTSLVFVAVQSAVYVASAVYIRRKLPDFFPWWRGSDVRLGLANLAKSFWLTMGSVLQQGSVSGMVLLVSALSGPAAVAIFATVRTLTNLGATFANVLTSPLLPEVVRYHANREGGKLVAIHEAHWVLVGTAVNLGILLCFPLIRPLYGFWTRYRVALDGTLLCLLLAAVAVASAGALMSTYLAGINNIRSVFSTSFVRGAIGLVGGLALHGRFGIAAFGLSVLVAELVVLAILFMVFFRSELQDLGLRPPVLPFALLLAGVGLTSLSLAFEGFGLPGSAHVRLLSVVGVMVCARFGWRRLDPEVRTRIVEMTLDKFRVRKPA